MSSRLRRTAALPPSVVSHELDTSLKALGTDFIDLYPLHYDHPAARVEPVMELLNGHIDEGKVSTIGALNWSDERIASANPFVASNGLKPFSASSVQFSVAGLSKRFDMAGPTDSSTGGGRNGNDFLCFVRSICRMTGRCGRR
jgi:aryl-alcohol dehydrogenase-like predicted oxidoreductase